MTNRLEVLMDPAPSRVDKAYFLLYVANFPEIGDGVGRGGRSVVKVLVFGVNVR